MLAGELNLVEGSRKITRLRLMIADPDDRIFDTIRGVESETDHLPIGDERVHWATDALGEKDQALQSYIDTVRDHILESCALIVAKYGTDDA
jgi:hypothetical protein